MKERVAYFDTYRFLAAMLIFATHYISKFSRVTFRYWSIFPYSIVLHGINGKLGVSMLCVILGYFAYRKGEKSKESLIALSLKRYTYFVVMAGLYYIIASFVKNYSVSDSFFGSVAFFAKEALLLNDKYNGLFWTLIPMLIGSVVCYILGRSQTKTGGVLLMGAAFLLADEVWVFNCIIGCLIAVWQYNDLVKKIMSHWWTRLIAFILAFCAIKAPESFRTYMLQGFFCVVVVIITMNSDKLAKFMGAPIWTKVNRSYFSLYIFHSLLYHNLGAKLIRMDGAMPFKARFVLVFLLITLIVIVLSKPLDSIVGFISKRIYRIIDKVDKKVTDFFSSRKEMA